MNTISKKISASMLFALAGSLLAVGCECNKEHRDSTSKMNTGYRSSSQSGADTGYSSTNSANTRTTHDTPRYNTPADNNITGAVDHNDSSTSMAARESERQARDDSMRARTDWRTSNDQNFQHDRYARNSDREYVNNGQEGTHLDTNAPGRMTHNSGTDSRNSNWDTTRTTDGTYANNMNDGYRHGESEYMTDIYGREFHAHPDNFEYTYDEQLGVYLVANTPTRSVRYDNRDLNESRTASRDRETNRDIGQSSSRTYSNNTESSPAMTPITRVDTNDTSSRAATTPAPVATTRTDSKDNLQSVTSNWSTEQKEAINMLVAKYGQPDEVTASCVSWKDKGGFVCTKVLKEAVDHKFPMAHKDFLAQTISYKVPADMASDIIAFDGSLTVDRTRGTLTACCDKEENNLLAFNLANDIVKGTKNVAQARAAFAQIAMAAKNGQKDKYMQGLQFEARTANAADPDHPLDSTRAGVEEEK